MPSNGPPGLLKVALLTTDNRWVFRDFDNPAPHFGPAPEALIQGLARHPRVRLHIVSSTRRRMAAPEKLSDTVWFHSQQVPKIGWTRTAYQGCIRATRRTLAAIQPDIVHGQGTESDCSISAVFSGYPNVLTVHGNMRLIARLTRARRFSHPWLTAWFERFTLPRSDGVVCITRYTQQAVAGLARRSWLVPNAVDASFFDVKAHPSPAAAPRILCVGLVCLRKNQNEFIRALDPLAAKRKFELVFLGSAAEPNPYRAEFLGLVRERPWCRHPGSVGREALKAHLREATLLVLPSLEDNCPMVILEAMAAGVPVVAAKVGGVPDLVEEGKTGVFCDPTDAASMSGAVERMLSNPAEAMEMAARARQHAREHFHPEVIARRHVEIYGEVLGRRCAS